MNVLVVGKGGREHAIVRALSLSSKVNGLHALPGSDGMSRLALCHSESSLEFDAVLKVVQKNAIDLVVVGPEVELAAGIADFLRDKGVLVFGPSQKAAQLEASKVFCKEFLQQANVPTADFFKVTNVKETLGAANNFSAPFVFKADGLAAGKGVFICKDIQELEIAARSIFEEKSLGSAGNVALLEKFQPGWELSYLVLTNGRDFRPLPLAQDHKRLLENNEGPNTGGMGAVAPLAIDLQLEEEIHSKIIQPIIKHLEKLELDYRGVLYVGIMVTDSGPSVLEINVRFGDPEAQVLLPLLDGDWGEVFYNLAKGELSVLSWKPMFASCIVLAAPGYPKSSQKDVVIEGDLKFESPSSYFLHAGSKTNAQNEWVTEGGRVLNAIGLGSDLKESLQHSYAQANKVSWSGLQMRKDIGAKL